MTVPRGKRNREGAGGNGESRDNRRVLRLWRRRTTKNRQRQRLRDQFFSCSVFQLKATADSSAALRDDKPETRAPAGATAKNQALVAMGDSTRSCFAPAAQ